MRKDISHLSLVLVATFVIAATAMTGCRSSVSNMSWPSLAWWKKEPAADAIASRTSPTYPTPPSTHFHPRPAATAGSANVPASYSDYTAGSGGRTPAYPNTGYGSPAGGSNSSYTAGASNGYSGANPNKGYYPLSPPANNNNGYSPNGYTQGNPSPSSYGSSTSASSGSYPQGSNSRGSYPSSGYSSGSSTPGTTGPYGGYNAPRSADARNAYPGAAPSTQTPGYQGTSGSYPSYSSGNSSTTTAPYGASGAAASNPWAADAGRTPPANSSPSWGGSGSGQTGYTSPYGQSSGSPAWNSGASSKPDQNYASPGPNSVPNNPSASYSQLSSTYGQNPAGSSTGTATRSTANPVDGLAQRHGGYSPGSIGQSYNRTASANGDTSGQVQRANYENSPESGSQSGQISSGGEFQTNSPFDG